MTRTARALVLTIVVSACTGGTVESFEPPSPPTFPSATSTSSGSTEVPTTVTTSTTLGTTTTTLPPLEPSTYDSIDRYKVVRSFTRFYSSRGLIRWQRSVPDIEDLRIPSSVDGTEQRMLWLAPRGDRDRPLLVVLHSWSSPYDQHVGIPFAMWAQENGWAVVAPNFRGINDDAEAMGSDLAVQDVIDAIDYGISQEGVDPNRVYAVGVSGGGMMALLLAGRHPDRVSAVAAWGGVHDLVAFYSQSRASGTRYAGQIARVCGGDPRVAGPVQDECLHRSPVTHLEAAREAVPVYLAHGIRDTLLRPSHSANAFNQLADPEDRFTAEEVDEFGRRRIPEHLSGDVTVETFFAEGEPAVVFARQSATVLLVFFQSNHEMVYAPALRWFSTDP